MCVHLYQRAHALRDKPVPRIQFSRQREAISKRSTKHPAWIALFIIFYRLRFNNKCEDQNT